MTREEYTVIWLQTKKAFDYLYRKKFEYFSTSIPSGYERAHFSCYEVHADAKSIAHVRKTYPLAKITFI